MAPSIMELVTGRDRIERRRRAEVALERFCKDAQAPAGIPEQVASSWVRTRGYGIDPDLAAPRLVIGTDDLRDRCESDIGFRLAQPILADFAADLADHCLAYLDGSGSMLSISGDGAVIDAIGDICFRPGVCWTERSAGTNGPGTALASGRPVEVFSAEHYVAAWRSWSCAAAPITLPGESAPIAVVDVTGRWDVCSHDALRLATAVAGIIRQRLLGALGVRAEVVRHVFKAAAGTGDALAAVDCRGTVLTLNEAASRRGLFGRGALPPELYGALSRSVFAGGASSKDEHQVELPGGVPCVVAPVRFEGLPVGAVLRIAEGGARPAPQRVRRGGVRYDLGAIVGASQAIAATIELARLAAANDLPVVLCGESGTGKELFAQAIHAESARRTAPFVPINCGAIPAELVEAELFGYEEGAFTGARRGGAPGRFEDAHGGTLFLDEVSELPPHAQTALLRLLQEHEVVRVGASMPRSVDVRIVAATNRPLTDEVQAGRFRQDLFYRLNVLSIAVPPLRERGEDVVFLAEEFLTAAARELDRPVLTLTPDARVALRQHAWPGNVRELRNLIFRAAATAKDHELTGRALGLEAVGPEAPVPSDGDASLRGARDESERRQLVQTLEACGWNFARAASRLEVSRMTLYRLAHKYGIKRVTRAGGV